MGEADEVDKLASLFGCKARRLAASHLCLPLGVSSCAVWDAVGRFNRRLTSCKKSHSKGGRLVLINSTLEPSNLFHVPFYNSQKSETN